MEGPEQNKSFQETYERLVESCYSHEMYGSGNLNLPRPVIVSDAATKKYITNGTQVLNWDVPDTFKAYSFGHELRTGLATANTFSFRYYTDNNHRVGTLLAAAPRAPGFYWAEADLPTGAKAFSGVHLNGTGTDRYGFRYTAGQSLPGVNGTGTANSARVRGFVRFEIAMQEFTVTFLVNGEVYMAPAVELGSTATLPVDPVWHGYSFEGWNLGDEPYDFSTPVTGDITLVSQWSRNPITSLLISNTQGVAAPTATTVTRNSSFQFDYVINPDALHEGIVWSVSDTSYATVNADTGLVTTKNKTGTAVLTAKDPLNGISHSIVLRIV